MPRRWRQRAGACLPSPPLWERSACQDTCVSQRTLLAGAQHSGRRETRVRRRYGSQIVTDGVPTHTTTFVHAVAWIVTPNLFCGVPAHTTTLVHAGAWTVTIDSLFGALFGVPVHTTTLVHAGAWTVTIDSLFGVPARTNTFVHAGAWTVTNDCVPQQCTPRIRTSTYAVPNTVVINMCESYTHIPLHSVPVHKLAVGEISLIATCMGVITY